ncbi:MAG: class I SAM-dependent methyltransferase [Planctomycetes bacterium]|nr:class I SAM-dependent methyltransferase [Planctomycetota bacterium]
MIPTLADSLLPVLYEDEFLLAVAKPAGVDTSVLQRGSPPGVVELIRELRASDNTSPLHPVNRLSRYESGILLLAKEPDVLRSVRAALRTGRVTLDYLAVVLGSVGKAQIIIGGQHGTSRGKTRSPVAKPRTTGSEGRRPGKVVPPTTVRALRTGKSHSLVSCRTTLETTHALRAQLRAANLRLVGDQLHGGRFKKPDPASTCLHLTRIVLVDPRSKRKVTITLKAPGGFDAALAAKPDVERPLAAALARRLPLIARADTDSYRLLTGRYEGVRGLVAERYGDVVILQVLEEYAKLVSSLRAIAQWYQRMLGVQAVYVKRFAKDRDGANESTHGRAGLSRLLVGRPAPFEITITEHELRYRIRPDDGLAVGLFPDQRENRRRVRDSAKGREVLNLFAYTCGFSVAAAAGGAGSTTSVDLSQKHLDWGQANFTLNDLDPADHEFVRSDAAGYLKRAQRDGRQFDLAILDPPSFAHGRKRGQSFSIAKDLPGLVAAVVALLRRDGVLMVSTNYRRMSLRQFCDLVKAGAGQRRSEVIATPALPPDFAVDPDHAKSILLQLE